MKKLIIFFGLFCAIRVVCYAENLPTGWTTIASSNSTITSLYATSGSNGITIQNNSTYTINGNLNLNAAGNDFSITVNGGSTLYITGALISNSASYTIYITVNSGGYLFIGSGISVSNSINIQNNGSSTIDGGFTASGSGASITVNGSSNLTVNGNLTVGNNASVMVNGALTVNGNMTGGTGSTLTNNGGASTSVYGSLTGFTLSGNLAGINAYLPVKLVSFTASVNLDYVELNWQTASEENNDYFTIERADNTMDFEEILTIDGAGNSQKILDYSAKDNNAVNGVNYYRLKQTDFDGVFTYSKIIALQSANNISSLDCRLDVYPIPCNNENITLNLQGVEKGNQINIKITTINGHLVYNENVIVTGQTIKIHHRLKRGYYILSTTTGNNILAANIIVE